jgi:CSLREA domain-containing protein
MKSRLMLLVGTMMMVGIFTACSMQSTPQAAPTVQILPVSPNVLSTLEFTPTGTLPIIPLNYPYGSDIVNTADDHDDGVCNAFDCTLREAINLKNVSGYGSIVFGIPGAGIQTIHLNSPLPTIMRKTAIAGNSQPGYNGTPIIVIDGSLIGDTNGNSNGINIAGGGEDTGNGTLIQGLDIINFKNCGIRVDAENVIVVIGRNYIGVDSTGIIKQGNNRGICIYSGEVYVGGASYSHPNVISGNAIGIEYNPPAGSNVETRIGSNFIGTDPTGTMAVGNTSYGIHVVNDFNAELKIGEGDGTGDPFFGNTGTGVGNTISGNGGDGIKIESSFSAKKIIILNNRIGVATDGTSSLPNGGNGIWVSGGRFLDIDHNVIAHNISNGVFVQTGIDAAAASVASNADTIRHNAIFENGKLGIAIDEDGVIPNDALDADAGANNRQNYPTLTSAVLNGNILTMNGTLTSGSGEPYAVDFYLSAACDPSGFGEGEVEIGSDSLVTNLDGLGMINKTTTLVFSGQGFFLTSTATDKDGNTSEFSKCIPVTVPLQTLPSIETVVPTTKNIIPPIISVTPTNTPVVRQLPTKTSTPRVRPTFTPTRTKEIPR